MITGSTSAATAVTNLISRILGTIRTAADDTTAETAQTAAVRDGLATEAKQYTAKTAIDAILVDTDETIPATLVSMSGATFDTGTDSLEAIRNRGDAAWVTAAGFATPQDVSPTINFNPTVNPTPVTVNPTELSNNSINDIRNGLSTFNPAITSVTVGSYEIGQSPDELIDLNTTNNKIDEAKTHAAIAALNTQN